MKNVMEWKGDKDTEKRALCMEKKPQYGRNGELNDMEEPGLGYS